jgi:hypothetical protein
MIFPITALSANSEGGARELPIIFMCPPACRHCLCSIPGSNPDPTKLIGERLTDSFEVISGFDDSRSGPNQP